MLLFRSELLPIWGFFCVKVENGNLWSLRIAGYLKDFVIELIEDEVLGKICNYFYEIFILFL